MLDRRGFTLIELLVVIAIIGILSAVVLASLNTARDKGADANIKSNLDSIRAQAELEYDDAGNSYDGVCGDSTVTQAIASANSANGGTGIDTWCQDDGDEWVVAAVLKTSTNKWCVDCKGVATSTTKTFGSLVDGNIDCD